MLHYVIGASTIDGSNDGRFIIESQDVAESHRVTRAKLKPEKILERSRDVLAPIVNRNPSQVHSIDEDSSLVGLVEPRQQLNQRTFCRRSLRRPQSHSLVSDRGSHLRAHGASCPDTRTTHARGGCHRQGGRARACPHALSAPQHSPPATPAGGNRRARCHAEIRFPRQSRRCRPTAASPRPAPAAPVRTSRGVPL